LSLEELSPPPPPPPQPTITEKEIVTTKSAKNIFSTGASLWEFSIQLQLIT
jgi:hypothetical protein